jgi:hypothetical protein
MHCHLAAIPAQPPKRETRPTWPLRRGSDRRGIVNLTNPGTSLRNFQVRVRLRAQYCKTTTVPNEWKLPQRRLRQFKLTMPSRYLRGIGAAGPSAARGQRLIVVIRPRRGKLRQDFAGSVAKFAFDADSEYITS